MCPPTALGCSQLLSVTVSQISEDEEAIWTQRLKDEYSILKESLSVNSQKETKEEICPLIRHTKRMSDIFKNH